MREWSEETLAEFEAAREQHRLELGIEAAALAALVDLMSKPCDDDPEPNVVPYCRPCRRPFLRYVLWRALRRLKLPLDGDEPLPVLAELFAEKANVDTRHPYVFLHRGGEGGFRFVRKNGKGCWVSTWRGPTETLTGSFGAHGSLCGPEVRVMLRPMRGSPFVLWEWNDVGYGGHTKEFSVFDDALAAMSDAE